MRAPLFFGHGRTSTGMSVSDMKRHLSPIEKIFMHNGVIGEFEGVRTI